MKVGIAIMTKMPWDRRRPCCFLLQMMRQPIVAVMMRMMMRMTAKSARPASH